MAKLSKADRDKLPKADFGDPDRRLFPITDQNDLDSAAHLIGKAQNPEAVKRRIIAIAKRKGLTIPAAWQTADHSTFSLGPAVSFAGGTVIRTGKIWEAGEYEDKAFGMTPEEVFEAIADFEPIAITDTHPDPAHQSVFDGKLGRLVSVELADDGWSLMGTAEVPEWVNAALPDAIPLSVGWNRETRKPDHVALVRNPRVTDAALSAAFASFAARHNTPQGQSAMQDMHDAAARAGAVCKAPTANMASRHEASATQQIHDISVEHGATCASMSSRGGAMPWFSQSRGGVMSWASEFGKWVKGGFQGDPPEPEPENPTPPTQPQPQPQPTPAGFSGAVAGGISGAIITPDPKLTALEAKVARFEAAEQQRIEAEAVAFAQGEVAAEHILPDPAQVALAKERYLLAAREDAEKGVVTFSTGATTRVAMLRADYAARGAHGLTRQQIPGTANMSTEPRDAVQQAVEAARAYAERANGQARR